MRCKACDRALNDGAAWHEGLQGPENLCPTCLESVYEVLGEQKRVDDAAIYLDKVEEGGV
jgi:hypothetical protein